MALRMADVPEGGSRIAYAVLATILAGVGGALVAVVAWPLLTNDQTCASDQTGLCAPALGLAMDAVGFWLVLMWLSFVFRLGWLFVLMVVVGQLVGLQLAVVSVTLWPLLLGLLVVPLGAWLSSPNRLRPTGRAVFGRVLGEESAVSPRRTLAIAGVCAVLLGQLAVWLWRLLA